MTDADLPPKAPIKTARKSLMQRISIVWIVPLLAMAVVLGIAWQNYADRGPLIEIAFDSASGVRANETELRYRDVTIGRVEKVAFASDLSKVLVSVRLEKEVANYVDADARFWVVRPQVSTRGVTGLDTVLSGVFIEGLWDDKPGGLQDHFTGLATAPLDRLGAEGIQLTLRTTGETTLTENTPVIYRGIEVGRVGPPRITADGMGSEADILIYASHRALISSTTRFWDTSGFSFSLGPAGAEVNFSSLATLLSGGITFETIESGGEPVKPGQVFSVFADEAEARANLFASAVGATLSLTAIFKENAAGLAVNAPVIFKGLQIGKVTALTGKVDRDRFGNEDMHLIATMSIQISKLGLDAGADADGDAALAFLDGQVADAGLRARLATASILTGGLNVELVDVPNAPPAEIERRTSGNPIMPTTKSQISDVSATAEGVLQRINALPVEELLNTGIELMNNVNTLIRSDDLQAMPGNVNGLLTDARSVVGSEQVKTTLANLNAALTDLSAILGQVREGKAVENANAAMQSASTAANSFAEATSDLPKLISRADEVLRQASETLRGLSADGGMTRDARAALKQVEEAARAVSSLARALQRNPSSLLTGR